MVQFKTLRVTAKSDYNAGSAILNISGDSWTLGVGVGVGLLKRKARVLISERGQA
jgi:hypothetical protein